MSEKIYIIVHYRNGSEDSTEKGTFEDLLRKHQVDVDYVVKDKTTPLPTNIDELLQIMNTALIRIGLYREHYRLEDK